MRDAFSTIGKWTYRGSGGTTADPRVAALVKAAEAALGDATAGYERHGLSSETIAKLQKALAVMKEEPDVR